MYNFLYYIFYVLGFVGKRIEECLVYYMKLMVDDFSIFNVVFMYWNFEINLVY